MTLGATFKRTVRARAYDTPGRHFVSISRRNIVKNQPIYWQITNILEGAHERVPVPSSKGADSWTLGGSERFGISRSSVRWRRCWGAVSYVFQCFYSMGRCIFLLWRTQFCGDTGTKGCGSPESIETCGAREMIGS
jgi:hypothetical protein